jgi:O-antigen ligase
VTVALALALALLGVSLFAPPEIEPVGRMAAGLLAAAALALHASGRASILRGCCRASWFLLPPALTALLLVDGGRARVLDDAAACATFAAIVILGRGLARDGRAGTILPWALAIAGTLAAAQAMAQHHWAYPMQAAALRATGDPDAGPYLVRLEAGRPSGPFSLPAALAGFLALTVPLTAAGLRVSERRSLARRAALGVMLALQIYALWLTRSIGGALALAVALGWLFVPASRRPRAVLGALAALGGLVALVFAFERRAEIGAYSGSDPVSLRLGNWRAALAMIGDHPLLGVGPGRFGVFYPRYLGPGMNETIHAHNTFLEFAACWGAWSLPILAWLAACALRRRPGVDGASPWRQAAFASGVGFLAHNLIDFTFYLPGVALPAALLLGAGTAGPPEGRERSPAPRWTRALILACGLAVAFALAVQGVIAGRVAGLVDEARAEARAGRRDAAERTALRAAALRPGDPDPWAFVAQSIAANPGTAAPEDDAGRQARGLAAAIRATQLEPESAILHYTAALHLKASGDDAGAVIEAERARRLFPAKPLYQAPQ